MNDWPFWVKLMIQDCFGYKHTLSYYTLRPLIGEDVIVVWTLTPATIVRGLGGCNTLLQWSRLVCKVKGQCSLWGFLEAKPSKEKF